MSLILKGNFQAISLELRPLAALYPPPYFLYTVTIDTGSNAVGLSIPPPVTTESGDRNRSPIKRIL